MASYEDRDRCAPVDRALDEYEAADELGVEVKTMRMWRQNQRGPAWMKYGPGRTAAVRYRRSDLEAFKAAAVVEFDR